MLPIGISLYTVHDKLQENFAGTLLELGEIGYGGVQFWKTYGLAANEIAAAVRDAGLEPWGAHVTLEPLRDAFNETVAFYKTLGCPELTVSWGPPERLDTVADVCDLAAELNENGRRCAEAGLSLSYHNHWQEFEQKVEDGRDAYYVLLDALDPDLVKVELDLGWVAGTGTDPETVVRMVGGWCMTYHLREHSGEIGDNGRAVQTELGTGLIDWPGLIALGKFIGVRRYIVENGPTALDALESVRRSFDYVRGLEV